MRPICIKHYMKVRGIDSYVYNIGNERSLTSVEIEYLSGLMNFDRKICEIDSWCLILYDINDHDHVEKILVGYWDIFTKRQIDREEHLNNILYANES